MSLAERIMCKDVNDETKEGYVGHWIEKNSGGNKRQDIESKETERCATNADKRRQQALSGMST